MQLGRLFQYIVASWNWFGRSFSTPSFIVWLLRKEWLTNLCQLRFLKIHRDHPSKTSDFCATVAINQDKVTIEFRVWNQEPQTAVQLSYGILLGFCKDFTKQKTEHKQNVTIKFTHPFAVKCTWCDYKSGCIPFLFLCQYLLRFVPWNKFESSWLSVLVCIPSYHFAAVDPGLLRGETTIIRYVSLVFAK